MFKSAVMIEWIGNIIDVKGVFSHEEFENRELVYTKETEGYEQFWDPSVFV